MEREFKFRAWLKNVGIMLTVYVLDQTGNAGRGTHFERSKGYGEHGGQFVFNIDDAVLMQYTGLKDKNGKEIYEGDIVDLHPDENDKVWHRVIEWDTAAFHCKQIHGKANHPLHFHKHSPDPLWVVIGNIYSNPELINKATS